ncbi:MAG: PilN domain-containing protein [Gammaproteobacteria bacterium]|nr:PilN domain-containing protein [Gammaproteobacteria bacterium]MBU2479297.1 PilN domain-containing protein [Gammaproteobacteria bacterium]
MQQQINLFQPVFRRETKVFSARTLAQILALALVLMVGGVAMLQLQLTRHSDTRSLLDNQHRALETQLQVLEAQADAGELAALEARTQNLEDRLADGAIELTEIQGLMLERSQGFAPVFEALARHPLSGLWLTGLHLQGNDIELRGIALDPELVPQYLALLAEDPELSKWTLAVVQIERDSEVTGQLRFTLRSGDTARQGGR